MIQDGYGAWLTHWNLLSVLRALALMALIM